MNKILGSTIIAGDVGSGKSWTENAIVRELIRQKAQLVLIDPKLVELNEYKGEPEVQVYADNYDGITDAVRQAYQIVNARLKSMKKDNLKEWPGNPLYVVIDELLPITMDKNYKKNGTIENLNRIAIIGRAARVFLIICTQKATRKNVPDDVKTCFYNRVCLRQFDSRDYNYVLDEKVQPLRELFGECYVRTAGRAAVRMKSDDVVKYLMGEYTEKTEL